VAVIARVARGASVAGVLLVAWLLLASTPAAGGHGGALADDPAAEGTAVVGQATERLPGPTALARPSMYAALLGAVSALVVAGLSHALRIDGAPLRVRLLVGARLGRAPPTLAS
jgi:hypothetical protein